ncbi:preprotein translocase subunit YajC [Salinicola halophilus]|uniref:preprotein translocase subunit YajC n=1 Tax=Salinicola halophilus TaxID=184065 RepID=UPI000DA1C0D6|nr:preprotein translocase subunit YajC [Salinicola halophilus]
MAIWVCLLIAALLILSPMLSLRPGRSESPRSGVRRHAKRHGGELDFTQVPLARPDATLIGYRLRYPNDRTGSAFVAVRDEVASEVLDRACPQWRWREAPLPSLDREREAALMAWLETLPVDALVVESRERTLRIWWEESMSLERFEREWPTWVAMRETLAGSGRKR